MSEAVYLDHAATAFPKAPGVARAMSDFLERAAGNPGRGGHRLTVAATRAIEDAREEVAALLGADPERTLLGPGCTFWLNTLLESLLDQGDLVITSSLEHNAVMRPLRALEHKLGVRIHQLGGAPGTGVPTPEEARQAASELKPRLMVLTHTSNVSGAVLPIERIAEAIGPTPLIVDAAQSAGCLPLDFSSLGAAALVCSGHKGLLGPPGTGVLVLAEGLEVDPLVRGGTGSRSESEEMPELLPDRLEAGTPNGVGIVGLGAACRWLRGQGVATLHERTQHLLETALSRLGKVAGVSLVGLAEPGRRAALFSFRLAGWDQSELANWLDRTWGVLVRSGLHCAPSAHRRLGSFPAGTLRVGFGPFAELSHVDRLVEALEAAAKLKR